MGDDSQSSNASPTNTQVRTPKCRTPDQWFDLEYTYDDLYSTPIADMPFEVTCKRDPGIKQRGTTDAEGKAHVEGLIPGPLSVEFNPDSDAAERQEAAQLRKEMKQTLDSIIASIQQDAVYKEQAWEDTSDIMKGVIYAGAAAKGVWDGATEFVEFIAQAGAFLAKAGMAYADVWGCIVTGDIKTLERKLEQGRAKGEELADDAIETFENLFLLLSDEEVRDMLYDFPERYWDAHHSVDQVYMAGSAGSDLVVGVVLGALTGGAGAAAMAGKAVAKGGQAVTQVMELIAKLVPKLKKIKAKMSFNGTTKAKRQYKVRPDRPNQPHSSKHAADSNASGTNPNGDACPAVGKTCVDGEPISLITGEELLEQEDFTLPGLIPLSWKRLYRTSNPRNRGLGHGWTFPTCETLQIGNDAILYNDAEGRQIELPVPEIGQFTTNSAEGLFLHRDWHTVFYLKQPGQPDKLFIGKDTLKLAALIDTVGNRWDCFYNEQNQQIERLEASWGAVLEFQNSDKGLIQSIRERTSEGHKTLARYHYSPEQDLIAIEDAGGDAERFAYQNHIITQRTLRTGFNFYFQWDQLTPQARCLRQWGDATQPGADATYDYRFEWDTQARLTRSTDSNGGVREVHYDKRGQVIRETDPLGHTTHFEYDRHGRKIKTIDALGFEHNFYYDEVGNPTGQTDSAGGGFTLLYDEQHRPTCFTDAEGNSWAREYNDDGLISKTIDADGNETQYFYNALGLPELILDPAGQKQILAWSPTGQLLTRALEGPAGATEPTHYQYDAHGHVAQVQQGSHTTGYQHNAKGDVTAIHYPDGSRAGLAYNANRQLTAYTDSLGRTTRFEYDGLAQITRRIDPAGNSLHYHYDRERNLIGLTNENGERYQLSYDANERLIQEIGFDGRVQQYEYNPLGHLTAHIEGMHNSDDTLAAHTTRFERDPMGRLLHKHTPDGSDTTFSYDKNGRLASASNAQRTLTFAYTPNGQLQQETQDQHTLQHRYDPLGNRIATELPNGNALSYQYDPLGQFTALDYNGNRLTQLQRNQHGQEIARTQGNLQAGYDYDPAGRLTRHWVQNHSAQSREAIIDRQYHYDSAGRLGLIDDLRKGRTQYHYDALDRLKAVEGYSREQFEFDPAGNILSPQNSAQTGQPAKTPGNRLAFHGDRHFTYDDRGNLIEERRGTGGTLRTRYHYNSQNQLIKVEKTSAGGVTQTTAYAYDPLGRRIHKQDGFGTTEFLWNGDVLLSEQRNHIDKLYLYEPNSFKPLAFIENNQCYFYHLDHLGTPQELTNWEGQIVWSARYRVYGNVLKQDVAAVENNLRFQGQYWDEETGLHYNRFRYYDPGTGQFTQQDPIGLLGGVNNYQYAPNPSGWVDPLGLVCKERYNRYKQYREQGLSVQDATRLSKTKPDFYGTQDGVTIIAPEGVPGKQSPWPVGLEPATVTTLPVGTKFNMAMSPGQAATRPGGFGTFDDIDSRNFVRDDLAVIREFKGVGQLERVEEFEVIQPLPVKSGPVGPQIEVDNGQFRPGGAHQIEMLVSPKDRTKYVQPTGSVKYFDVDDPDI